MANLLADSFWVCSSWVNVCLCIVVFGGSSTLFLVSVNMIFSVSFKVFLSVSLGFMG